MYSKPDPGHDVIVFQCKSRECIITGKLGCHFRLLRVYGYMVRIAGIYHRTNGKSNLYKGIALCGIRYVPGQCGAFIRRLQIIIKILSAKDLLNHACHFLPRINPTRIFVTIQDPDRVMGIHVKVGFVFPGPVFQVEIPE